jgi:hypothetical protein
MAKGKWYRIPTTMRVSQGEYQANINGMNMVFGAVLGFVLARAEALETMQFAFVLLLSAAVVVTILYLSSSEYRLFYAVAAIAAVAFLPVALNDMDIPPIPKLQPTLAVWVLMVLGIEMMPREPTEPETGDPSK